MRPVRGRQGVRLMRPAVYRRIPHAAHYPPGHPLKGHDLEQWDVASPRKPTPTELTAAMVPCTARYHSGYVKDGVQHWVFVCEAPLTAGHACGACGTATALS